MMMRKLMATTLILSSALALSACGRTQIPSATFHSLPRTVNTQVAKQAPVQLIVRFRKDASRTALQAFSHKYQLQTLNYLPQIDAYIMTLRAPLAGQAQLQAMLGRMQQESVAALVEINHEIQVAPVNYDMTISPIFNQ
ncbi:MAG: hypothetical protein CVV27_06135 [Candidatus Melainabacteria bacterium HGW-Melainabacteria-1]|nr:MAG: hypothetical protein CVV27_06135 [Candidatus Melainabacteria bacterium HGW-Melainabacteria-1]